MKVTGKEELEFLAALIQEYIEKMPQATQLAVLKHTQECVDKVYKCIEDLHIIRSIPAPTAEEQNLVA
jgi:hypothetical protein